ncbi:ribonuclease domain-containing protein [Streptomyces sp. NPDC001941]|uniref:ribonuclease domain-containing protein n=1 Tax=Streptomyces sp. NPDC001941 TaxID=3154659 RepID=UPI003326BA84
MVSRSGRFTAVLVAVGVVLGLLLTGCGRQSGSQGGASPSPSRPPASASSGALRVADLPAEAHQTLRLIRKGGPFPYDKDGVVFGNFEKRLPSKKRGYYHEYTVRTPGERGRGARRIVTGSGGEVYYTADHYETFEEVEPDDAR